MAVGVRNQHGAWPEALQEGLTVTGAQGSGGLGGPGWGSATGEGGTLGAWGAAGSQPSEGPVSPEMRCGCSGQASASGLGEGSRLEMSLESSQEEESARRGQGLQQTVSSDCSPIGTNSEPKGVAVRRSTSLSHSFVKTTVSEFRDSVRRLQSSVVLRLQQRAPGRSRTALCPQWEESHQGTRLVSGSLLPSGLAPPFPPAAGQRPRHLHPGSHLPALASGTA